MHRIYTSPTLILHRDVLDTSASFLLLTKNFGLIRARAQGIRRPKSRLKGTLQEYSLATVAFVQTKAGWKITTAIPERNFWNDALSENKRKVIAHISQTVIRFVGKEDFDSKIFSLVYAGFTALMDEHASPLLIEVLTLSRLLQMLGLLAIEKKMEAIFAHHEDFSKDMLSLVAQHTSALIKEINRGFKESQL